MSIIIPPGYGQAALVFTSSTGTPPFVTTIGIDMQNYTDDYVGAANHVMQSYADAFKSVTDNDLTLDRCVLSVGQDGPGGSVDSDLAPIPMTSTATFGAVCIAVMLRKTTARLGRAGRGRMFLPGTHNENGVETDGTLTSAYRTTMSSAVSQFTAYLLGGVPPAAGAQPVLLHSTPNMAPDSLTLSVADMVGVIRGRIR